MIIRRKRNVILITNSTGFQKNTSVIYAENIPYKRKLNEAFKNTLQ